MEILSNFDETPLHSLLTSSLPWPGTKSLYDKQNDVTENTWRVTKAHLMIEGFTIFKALSG